MNLSSGLPREILLPIYGQALKIRDHLTDRGRVLMRWVESSDTNPAFTQVLVQEYVYKADAIEAACRQGRKTPRDRAETIGIDRADTAPRAGL
jgi:hypothetical protein